MTVELSRLPLSSSWIRLSSCATIRAFRMAHGKLQWLNRNNSLHLLPSLRMPIQRLALFRSPSPTPMQATCLAILDPVDVAERMRQGAMCKKGLRLLRPWVTALGTGAKIIRLPCGCITHHLSVGHTGIRLQHLVQHQALLVWHQALHRWLSKLLKHSP